MKKFIDFVENQIIDSEGSRSELSLEDIWNKNKGKAKLIKTKKIDNVEIYLYNDTFFYIEDKKYIAHIEYFSIEDKRLYIATTFSKKKRHYG